MYEIELRVPTLNTYYRRAGRIMHISEKGREFKEQVQWVLRSFKPEKVMGDVAVDITVFYRTRPADLDNTAKAILDSAKDILFGDDSRVMKLNLEKKVKAEKDKFIISVRSV